MNRQGVALFLILAWLMLIQPLGHPMAQGQQGQNQTPSYGFTQYPIPQNSSQPGSIASDSSGNLWFVEQASNMIAFFDPTTKEFHAYPIPTADAFPQGIAVDAQGDVWFAELTPSVLGEIPTGSSTIKEFAIPLGPNDIGCGPIGVTPHDGDVWVTCEFSSQIDEFNPRSSSFLGFDLPLFYSAPIQIVFDTSGNFWFTAADVGMLGYATVTQLQPGTSDGISEFAPINSSYITTISNPLLPAGGVRTSLSIPSGIAIAADGNSLWVTEHGGSSFDHYEIGTKSLVKYFTSPSSFPSYPNSLPNGIAVDAQGNVWVAEHGANKIAEFDTSTESMVEYPVPCCGKGIAGALYLTLGLNGNVWFTELFGNSIAELSPEPGAPPASTSLDPGSVEVGSTGSATVSVRVSWGASGRGPNQNFSFQASGVTATGALQNISADFSPAMTSTGTNTTESTTMSISTAGLNPGVYDITIGAQSSASGIVSSTFLVLTVPAGNQGLLLDAGIILAVVVLIGALYALRRRGRASRRPGRSRKA